MAITGRIARFWMSWPKRRIESFLLTIFRQDGMRVMDAKLEQFVAQLRQPPPAPAPGAPAKVRRAPAPERRAVLRAKPPSRGHRGALPAPGNRLWSDLTYGAVAALAII